MMMRLNEIFKELCIKWGYEIVEFNGESDHVHLLFGFYPQMQLSKFVNNLKTVSSIYIRKEFPIEMQQFYRKPVFWHSAYFIASCGGVTVEQLKRYVQEQDSPVDVEEPVGNSSDTTKHRRASFHRAGILAVEAKNK